MNGSSQPSPVDAELIGRLLDEHGAALALYAAQWTDVPDDCVQEALVELARQATRPENLRAWLYRVVKHRALNAARGARRRRERELQGHGGRFADDVARRDFDRLESLVLVEALDSLDATDREIIVLKIWGSLTYEEIAANLSVSAATVYRRYQQALVQLREALETPCSTNNQTNNP